MKRQQIYELLKAHFDKDEQGFLTVSKQIAREISKIGDKQLSDALNNLINNNIQTAASDSNEINDFFVSKSMKDYFELVEKALNLNLINKIFIYGKPGTGKTLFARTIAVNTHKSIREININEILDYRFGESMKNIENIFKDARGGIIFIDEVDSVASKRSGSKDLFEVNRILNTILKLVDSMTKDTTLIVSTNLFDSIDEAFIRRFDLTLNFDTYTKSDFKDLIDFFMKKHSIDLKEDVLKHFSNIVINTHRQWSPSYVEKALKLISIWQMAGKDVTTPLLQTMFSLKFPTNKLELKKMMTDNKVPVRAIDWLIKGIHYEETH